MASKPSSSARMVCCLRLSSKSAAFVASSADAATVVNAANFILRPLYGFIQPLPHDLLLSGSAVLVPVHRHARFAVQQTRQRSAVATQTSRCLGDVPANLFHALTDQFIQMRRVQHRSYTFAVVTAPRRKPLSCYHHRQLSTDRRHDRVAPWLCRFVIAASRLSTMAGQHGVWRQIMSASCWIY